MSGWIGRALRRRRYGEGFTLIELLVVIAILGILAAVVVFAVGGVKDKGTEAAKSTDERTLRTAEESYYAKFGRYGTEQELVDAGFLREVSTYNEVSVALSGQSYAIGGQPLPAAQQEIDVGFAADPWTTASGKRTFGRFSLDTGINETLTKLGEDYSVQPGLATSWEVIPGGTNPDYPGRPTWRFHLRPGVTFHSGAAFTAADVKWSLDRTREISPTLDTSLTMVSTGPSSVVVVDPLTVDITPRILTGTPAITNLRLPESFVHQFYGIYRNGTKPELYGTADPAGVMDGTGPFKFASYTASSEIVVTRNDSYWGPEARLNKITFKFISSATTRRLALEAGTIDAMFDVSRQEVNVLRANSGVQVLSAPPTYTYDVYLNVNGLAPYNKLTNENVRKALAMSIDRADFVSVNWPADMATVTNHIGPPSALGSYYSSISGYDFDLTAARNLLDDEGWTCGGGAPGAHTACTSGEVRQKAGTPLQLYMLANQTADDMQLLLDLESRFAAAGVDMVIGNDGAAKFTPRKDSGAFDLDNAVPNQNDANPAFLLIRQWWGNATQSFVACWSVSPATGQPCPYPDASVPPPNLPYRAGPWQWAGATFDGIVSQAMTAQTEAKAQEYSAAAMDHMMDHAIVLPIAAVSRVYGLRNNVAGFEPVNPALSFVRWDNVYLTT